MINTIPQVLINGLQTIFGGYIYNVKFTIAYGESKSSCSISVISESGTYSASQASLNNTYCSPYTIQIGSQITFIGYLETIDLKVSPSGNTLVLNFTDTSQILDIIQVGLFKRYGLSSGPNLLIVGFELDPCNPENYANPEATFFDPCSPCLNDQAQADIKNYVDCEEKAKYEIHDVKYNFTDLLTQIQFFTNIPIVGAVDPNPLYLQQYTGTLREVLSQWCQDFGFFFYWDSGNLIFQDLRNTIQVNQDISNFYPNLLEYDVTYSMKDSIQTGTLTDFSRPGDPAKIYECQDARYIELQSLLQEGQYSLPLTITPNIDKIAAGLSYYSQELRDLYYFYVKYEMYNLSSFFVGNILDKLGMTILSTAITLNGFNNSAYLSIDDAPTPSNISSIPANAASINPFTSDQLSQGQIDGIQAIMANDDYYQCVQLLDFESQWKVITNPDSFFFFLAEHNEVHHQRYVEEDREFASFLNKYAVFVPDPNDDFYEDYDFQLDNLCGINYFVNTGNVSYNFLGDSMGSLKFYNTSAETISVGAGTPMSELPFAKFLSIIYDNTNEDAANQLTNLGGFLSFKLIVAERGRNSFVPEPGAKSGGGSVAIKDYNLLGQVSKCLPLKINVKNNAQGSFIGRLLDNADVSSASNQNDIFLYLGCISNPDSFNLTQINGYNNIASFGTLFDGKPLNKEQDPTLQFEQIIYQYPELQCSIIGNHSFGSRLALHANVVVFKTPLGEFQYTEPTDALFGTVIEKTNKTRRIIEKIESFYLSSELENSCSVNKFKLNYRNISDDSLRVLTKNNDICQYDTDQILQIHQLFSANLALNYTQPTISKTFKIAGVDLNGYIPTIANGLLNLEISVDDKGVSSTYEFGTRLMILPAEKAVDYSSVNMLSPHGSYTNTVNYFPTVGQPNL